MEPYFAPVAKIRFEALLNTMVLFAVALKALPNLIKNRLVGRKLLRAAYDRKYIGCQLARGADERQRLAAGDGIAPDAMRMADGNLLKG